MFDRRARRRMAALILASQAALMAASLVALVRWMVA